MKRVTNKEMLGRRITLLQALGYKAWNFCGSRRESEEHKSCDTLAQDKGDADYLRTRRAKGNRWKHFGNQGRQSDT